MKQEGLKLDCSRRLLTRKKSHEEVGQCPLQGLLGGSGNWGLVHGQTVLTGGGGGAGGPLKFLLAPGYALSNGNKGMILFHSLLQTSHLAFF